MTTPLRRHAARPLIAVLADHERADRLRAARVAAGFTQVQAAALLPRPTSAQHWSDMENGHRRPSLEWLHEAALALGCDPHTLDERLQTNRPPSLL